MSRERDAKKGKVSDDYRALLKQLCAYEPQYVLFVRLSAGNIPSFVTRQVNVPGISSAYRFINAGELVEAMEQSGYTRTFASSGEELYDQSNFPEKYRMGYTCNLLFTKG